MPDEPKLKPCPFCNSPAKWFKRRAHEKRDSDRWLWWVECSKSECGAALSLGEWDQQHATEKWNRRAVEKEAK